MFNEIIYSIPASKVRIPSLKQQILNHGACDVCGCLYVPQIAENRRFHRKYHAEHLRPRFPKPNPRLADYSGDVKVDASSPRWLHQLVYDCARALKREERYDLVQWDKRGDIEASDDERDIHAFLMVEKSTPVGAASFSWVTREECGDSGWCMNFVWVADSWRKKGMLSKRWAGWVAKYAPLSVEHPLSDAMESFLDKNGGACNYP